MKRAAVFLDRDGTLIEDLHYARDAAKVALLPGVGEALRMMRSKGYLLFVVSNQSGVGRGIIRDRDFIAVHSRTMEVLREEQVEIDLFLYCFHRPEDDCTCRKPKPGLIPKLHGNDELDWSLSFTVGDKACDLELAEAIGAKGFLVLTGKGEATRKELEARSGAGQFPMCATLLEVAKLLPDAAIPKLFSSNVR